MTIEESLFAALTGFAGLSAIVGARIYPNVIPQGVANPVIRYHLIDGDTLPNLAGNDTTLKNAHVQIDIWSDIDSYKQGKETAEQVSLAIAAASTFEAIKLNQADQFDTDNNEHRVILNFSVWQ